MWVTSTEKKLTTRILLFGIYTLLVICCLLYVNTGYTHAQGTAGWDVDVISPADGSTVTSSAVKITIRYAYPQAQMKPPVPMTIAISRQYDFNSKTGAQKSEVIYKQTKQVQSPSDTITIPLDMTGKPGTYSILVRFGPYDITRRFYYNGTNVPGPGPNPEPESDWGTWVAVAAGAAAVVALGGAITKRKTKKVGTGDDKVQPPRPPKEKPLPCSLYIESDPRDAGIWVNFANWGETPDARTDLIPGIYRIMLKKEGYQTYYKNVDIAPNEIKTVRAVLEPGQDDTGWFKIDSDPTGAQVLVNDKGLGLTPWFRTKVAPGSYSIVLKKAGYQDYYDTVTVVADKPTVVFANLPPIDRVAEPEQVRKPVKQVVRPPKKGPPPKQVTTDLRKEWWDKASLEQRKSWDSFDEFLSKRLGPATFTGFQDRWGNPSWSSAYMSYEAAVKTGIKGTFEEWISGYKADKNMTEGMKANRYQWKGQRSKEIAEADAKYGDAARNHELMDKLSQISDAVASDAKLSYYANMAALTAVDSNNQVDVDKLSKIDYTLKRWIIRDKMIQSSEYTEADAWVDSAVPINKICNNVVVRGGSAILTGGVSEAAFVPMSATSRMVLEMASGKTAEEAVIAGGKQATFELALGEGLSRGGKALAQSRVGAYYQGTYVKPWANYLGENYKLAKLKLGIPEAVNDAAKSDGFKIWKMGKGNPELASDISRFNKMTSGVDDFSKYNRSALMKRSEVFKVGKTAPHILDEAEKKALDIWKTQGKELAKNSDLLPDKFKNALGTARQKVYENARNDAIKDTLKQIENEGIKTEGKTFVMNQTGTHAQPGNPGFNSIKSDFDHAAGFGKSRYNTLYEERLNANLESQGVKPAQMEANVYGPGTSGKGAYTGGSLKYVDYYNETTGSDIMVRNVKGEVIISRELPQTSESLLAKMQPKDIPSAIKNYQTFASDTIAKAGGVDKIISKPANLNTAIKNLSKEVSRLDMVNRVKYFQDTTKVSGYITPKAAEVAKYIKTYNLSVEQAVEQTGFTGSKLELFNEFLKILGL